MSTLEGVTDRAFQGVTWAPVYQGACVTGSTWEAGAEAHGGLLRTEFLALKV